MAGPVERAVRAELRGLKVSVQSQGAAAAAVALARLIDEADGLGSAAAAAHELRVTLEGFSGRQIVLERSAGAADVIDELRSRRRDREARES